MAAGIGSLAEHATGLVSVTATARNAQNANKYCNEDEKQIARDFFAIRCREPAEVSGWRPGGIYS